MSRKRRTTPWIARRGTKVWYIFFRGTERVFRVSCHTRDRSIAQAKLQSFIRGGERVDPTKRSKDQPWLSVARRMCKRARENSKAKNRKYSISPEFVLELIEKQDFRCAVTGIELSLPSRKRDPWAPSLDQVLPGKGYTTDNVRIVCMIVNTAMNCWGEQPVLELVRRASLHPESRASFPLFSNFTVSYDYLLS